MCERGEMSIGPSGKKREGHVAASGRDIAMTEIPVRVAQAHREVVQRARVWAEAGGLRWSDEEWDRQLAELRLALKELDEERGT